ncbi:MAG: dTDP-glucose 4,6-dehydratase [bacterium]|nr:dTDP-glucose 4,6-dehydratase [bacterium]
MRLLVTGGAGFIGSNFIRATLERYADVTIVNYDALTYAAHPDALADVAERFGPRYAFERGDITDSVRLLNVARTHRIEAVMNFAAETHVDRSIHVGARAFVETNVLGTCTLLDVVRQLDIARFVQVSTDEVFGALDLDDAAPFTEETAFAPNSPYAAAKAGGDLLCRAYARTHGTPVIVTHCSNNYGPYQFPEKLIPFVIFRALAGQPVPIYGDGKNVRDWIHVDDHASALHRVLHEGSTGETYGIGTNNERSNLEVVGAILDILGRPRSLMEFVADRPGHDRRYAIDATKMQQLGWAPLYTRERFADGLERTVRWYQEHRDWVERLRTRVGEVNAHLQGA